MFITNTMLFTNSLQKHVKENKRLMHSTFKFHGHHKEYYSDDTKVQMQM